MSLEDDWDRDNAVEEALNEEGKQGWECFAIENRGQMVLDDGSPRGREVHRTTLWLKKAM